MMDLSYYEEQVREWAAEGQDYEAIRHQLIIRGLSKEDQKTLLRLADQHILQYEFAQQARTNAIVRMIMGGAILFLGLFITLGSMYIMKNQYLLTYGLILAGAWILKGGYKLYKAPPSEVRASSFLRKRKKFERF
jgi:hypothetical protein